MGFHMLHEKETRSCSSQDGLELQKATTLILSSRAVVSSLSIFFFKKNLYILSHIFKLKIFSKVEILAKNVIFGIL